MCNPSAGRQAPLDATGSLFLMLIKVKCVDGAVTVFLSTAHCVTTGTVKGGIDETATTDGIFIFGRSRKRKCRSKMKSLSAIKLHYSSSSLFVP